MIVLTQPQEIDVTQPLEHEFPKEKFDELESFINSLEITKGALMKSFIKPGIFLAISRGMCSFLLYASWVFPVQRFMAW